jgi:hypothetical protein
MSLKACRECGKDVSTGAANCPHCGASHPTNATSKGARSCLGCLTVVVVISAIGAIGALVDAGNDSRSGSAGVAEHQAREMWAPELVNVRRGPGSTAAVAFQIESYQSVYVGRDTSSQGWAAVLSDSVGSDTLGFVKVSLLLAGAAPPRPDLELLDTRHEAERYGEGWATGRIRNNSSSAYRYVQVQINLLDGNGTVVGSTFDNVTHLGPGEIWRFKAPILEAFETYRIEDISGRR